MTGIDLIADERRRQVTEEGYDAAHDDAHVDEQLAAAAAVYAMPEGLRRSLSFKRLGVWPWPGTPLSYKPDPLDRKHDLVRAGALIAAELDRLIRAEEPTP